MDVTGLSAGLVPHRQWALRQWFYAPSMRYYHREQPGGRFVPGPRFYEHLDPALRNLCRLLHANGIRTTASCEGHDHDRDYFEQRWEALCDEAEAIRQNGLRVRESQSEQEYRFHDPRYQLPWLDFSEFWKESRLHQSKGYLGIVIPFTSYALEQRLQKASQRRWRPGMALDEGVGNRIGGRLYHLLVEGDGPEDRARQWQRITEWFRGALD